MSIFCPFGFYNLDEYVESQSSWFLGSGLVHILNPNHIVFQDLDEYLVPRKHPNLLEMLEELNTPDSGNTRFLQVDLIYGATLIGGVRIQLNHDWWTQFIMFYPAPAY